MLILLIAPKIYLKAKCLFQVETKNFLATQRNRNSLEGRTGKAVFGGGMELEQAGSWWSAGPWGSSSGPLVLPVMQKVVLPAPSTHWCCRDSLVWFREEGISFSNFSSTSLWWISGWNSRNGCRSFWGLQPMRINGGETRLSSQLVNSFFSICKVTWGLETPWHR